MGVLFSHELAVSFTQMGNGNISLWEADFPAILVLLYLWETQNVVRDFFFYDYEKEL